MKYLINRKTKEHKAATAEDIRLIEHFGLNLDIFLLVEADSEGWIAHMGNECPLPDDVRCEVRTTKTGSRHYYARESRDWDWDHDYNAITHYRPILETEKTQEPEPHPTEFQKSCVEAMQKRFYPEPTDRNNELLDRLKAAHEHAQQIPDLEAELREVLGSMGYDLVARRPFVEQNPDTKTPINLCQEDMTEAVEADQWTRGCTIVCVDNKGMEEVLTEGCVYRIKKMCLDYGSLVVDRSDRARSEECKVRRFRFHSRPAKVEK